MFGGPGLEELKRGDLAGITQLEELTVHANNLKRYEIETRLLTRWGRILYSQWWLSDTDGMSLRFCCTVLLQIWVWYSSRHLATGSRYFESPRSIFDQWKLHFDRAWWRVVSWDACDSRRPPSDWEPVCSTPARSSQEENQVNFQTRIPTEYHNYIRRTDLSWSSQNFLDDSFSSGLNFHTETFPTVIPLDWCFPSGI